jgi:Flp pilus assembly protein TadG
MQGLQVMAFSRLIADIKGSVVPVAAVMLIALAPMTGLAVDFVYAANARTALQEAVDAALLAVARENPDNQGDIDQIANRFFRANLDDRYDLANLTVTVNREEDGAYTGTAAGDVPLWFGGFFGQDQMRTAVDGSVRVNLTDLEVVLALDTTGSMLGSKLSALKTAATGFVDTMMTGDNVRTGIVPFARYVNIGLSNRNEPGFNIPADTRACRMEWRNENYNCRNCRSTPRTGVCYNDGTPYTCTWTETRCDCDTRRVEREVCDIQKWHGCVGSRDEPRNSTDEDATVNKIPGLLNRSCGAALTRLTNDATTLRRAVNNLTATGETYIPSGLSMAWATLSHRVPFTQGSDPSIPSNRNLLRAIVLMTDGANTASKRPSQPDHEGNNAGAANILATQLCNNIKADNVILFTVSFDVSDANIRSLLRGCATSPGYAFEADNAAELQSAFDRIANALSRLRLTE